MGVSQKDSLYFVGFRGRLNHIANDSENVSYVPDANLVLRLIRYKSGKETLSNKQKHFLQISRAVANEAWKLPTPKIVINPTLAIMELTKQHENVCFDRFESMFNEFLQDVYGLYGYDPLWVIHIYGSAMQAFVNTHLTIACTVRKIYSLVGACDKPTDTEIIAGCQQLLSWLWAYRKKLVLIGGPLLYVAVYAVAGSPDAQQFLKVRKAQKGCSAALANNVAWDFLYWVLQDMEYHRAQLGDTIVCSSDRPLARLLGSRVNRGPRSGINSRSQPCFIESFGEIQPFRFRRLENTKLEKNWKKLSCPF